MPARLTFFTIVPGLTPWLFGVGSATHTSATWVLPFTLLMLKIVPWNGTPLSVPVIHVPDVRVLRVNCGLTLTTPPGVPGIGTAPFTRVAPIGRVLLTPVIVPRSFTVLTGCTAAALLPPPPHPARTTRGLARN